MKAMMMVLLFAGSVCAQGWKIEYATTADEEKATPKNSLEGVIPQSISHLQKSESRTTQAPIVFADLNSSEDSSSFQLAQAVKLTSLGLRDDLLRQVSESRPRLEPGLSDPIQMASRSRKSTSATIRPTSMDRGSRLFRQVSQQPSSVIIEGAERVRINQPMLAGCSGMSMHSNVPLLLVGRPRWFLGERMQARRAQRIQARQSRRGRAMRSCNGN